MSRERQVGWAGIALGVLAFFVAVPPIMVRSPVPIVAARAGRRSPPGALAARGGEKRLGWGAIASGLFGIAGGIAATQLGRGAPRGGRRLGRAAGLDAALRHAADARRARRALLRALRRHQHRARGHDADRRVLRRLGADKTGSWVLGIVIAIVAGAVFAALHALFAVTLRADQIVSGTALNLLAVGITGYLYVDIYGTQGTPDDLPGVPDVHLPIKSVPLIGDVFGQLNLMVWLTLALVLRDLGRRLPDARSACGCAPSARTRSRPRPRACRSCARATWP